MANERFRHRLLGIASGAAIATAFLIGAPAAKATIVVQYSTDDVNWIALSNPSSGDIGGVDFSNLSFSSNLPGSALLADAAGSDTGISSSGGTNTVYLAVTFSGYDAPPIPPNGLLSSNIGGTVSSANPNNALSFTSCIFNTDPTSETSCAGATYTTAAVMPAVTSTGNYSTGDSEVLSSVTSPYSLVELLTITVGGEGDLNFAASTTVTPVPEPVTLSVIGTALVGMGIARRRRRG